MREGGVGGTVFTLHNRQHRLLTVEQVQQSRCSRAGDGTDSTAADGADAVADGIADGIAVIWIRGEDDELIKGIDDEKGGGNGRKKEG